jgi:hypothetical protein
MLVSQSSILTRLQRNIQCDHNAFGINVKAYMFVAKSQLHPNSVQIPGTARDYPHRKNAFMVDWPAIANLKKFHSTCGM